MKLKYQINLEHWNYIGNIQKRFSLKYFIKKNQDVWRNFKVCTRAIHLMRTNDKRYKKVQG